MDPSPHAPSASLARPSPSLRRVVLVAAALLTAAAGFTGPGCIDARCTRDRECPVGETCELATGVCVTPECSSHATCGAGRVCDDHHCVPGCVADGECPGEQRCLELRCVPFDALCACPLAPSFCGSDLNPRSETASATVCVPGERDATVLVFGSVGCSHCQALLTGVLALGARLAEAPPVAFVQLPDRPVDPSGVAASFASFTVPVLQDSEALGVLGRYGADWYHVVLVDGHGCLVGHWGPLAASDLEGAPGAELEAAWGTALGGACPAPAGTR